MTLIVCIDDKNGLLFNHRRQSRDRVLIEDLLGTLLWLSDDSASIIVKSDADLMSSHVAQISEIVYTEAGILPANVKIICK